MRDIVITSSVLIMAVLLIRYLAKGRLTPALQYALWLPVVARLLLPIPLWSSRFSVLNFIPDDRITDETAGTAEGLSERPDPETGRGGWQSGPANEKMTGTAAGTDAAEITVDMADQEKEQNGRESHFEKNDGGFPVMREQMPEYGAFSGSLLPGGSFSAEGLPYIWAAGMLLVGGYMLFFQIRWQSYLRSNRKPLAGQGRYRGKLSVYTVENLPSPCLTGRCIYLTEEMAKEPEQLAHILAHEYCHYRQLDSLWVIVRCVLTALYWFHPLVWAAAYVSKQDSELACDAAAIRLLGEKERLAYGKTLLRLIAGNGHDKSRIGLASTMSGGEKGIRERISRIAGKPRYMVITAGIVVLFIVAVIAVTFSGTKDAQGRDGQIGETENLPVLAEQADGQGMEPSGEQEAELQQEIALKMEMEQKQMAALEEQMAALEKEQKEQLETMERERAVLEELASYDAGIDASGSREGVFGITGALDLSDYVQACYENGEAALEEGIYLLEVYQGPDGSDIGIYGMYSEEYGCEGIKILIGDDANDFDEKWLVSWMHGREGNVRLYESAEDGMPRTFASKMAAVNTSDRELWNLYLCDRYDTGTIELYTIRPEELFGQIRERLRFEIHTEESSIDVYDNGKMVGSISVNASDEVMEDISEVIVDDSSADWELGNSEKEIRMIFSIGLKLRTTDSIWYNNGSSLLSIPVSCGSFGDRKTELGQVSIETAYKRAVPHQDEASDHYSESAEDDAGKENAGAKASAGTTDRTDKTTDILKTAFDDGGHHDVAVQYVNPCPGSRISDTFGVRTHPVTGEEKAHDGIDFAAKEGTDILAAADGTVYKTGFDTVSGNYVVLYHVMNGEFTYYACCQEILVTEGSSVAAGQKIATVGSTGRSTGPHLHFALSRDGEYIEPVFE